MAAFGNKLPRYEQSTKVSRLKQRAPLRFPQLKPLIILPMEIVIKAASGAGYYLKEWKEPMGNVNLMDISFIEDDEEDVFIGQSFIDELFHPEREDSFDLEEWMEGGTELTQYPLDESDSSETTSDQSTLDLAAWMEGGSELTQYPIDITSCSVATSSQQTFDVAAWMEGETELTQYSLSDSVTFIDTSETIKPKQMNVPSYSRATKSSAKKNRMKSPVRRNVGRYLRCA